MDWGFLSSLTNASGYTSAAEEALSWAPSNWSSATASLLSYSSLFNLSSSSPQYELQLGYNSLYQNFTANQTEWAGFIAQCYGIAAGKAGLVAAGSSAACALLPLSCVPLGAYSMYQNVHAAATLYNEGIEGIDPCAETRKAFPSEEAALFAQAAAVTIPNPSTAPLVSLLTSACLLIVLLVSLLARRRSRRQSVVEALV